MFTISTYIICITLYAFKFVAPKPEATLEDEVWNCPPGSEISGEEIRIPISPDYLPESLQINFAGSLKVCKENYTKFIP